MDKRWRRFWLVNGAFLAFALLLLPALYFADALGVRRLFFNCPFHDLFSLYCPTCGFTRAFLSLLRFDFLGALRANPTAVLFVGAVAYFDVRAFISLKRGEERVLHARLWHFFAFVAIAVAYCVARNVLLRVWGIDFLGDFG